MHFSARISFRFASRDNGVCECMCACVCIWCVCVCVCVWGGALSYGVFLIAFLIIMLHITVGDLSLSIPLDEPYNLISIEILVSIKLDGNLPVGTSMERSWTRWARHQNLHIGASKITIIGSDYGLSHSRRQAIIWTNAQLRNQENAFENIVCEMTAICLCLNVLGKTYQPVIVPSPVK